MTRDCLIIINADDLGRTPGVSEGILQAHLHGIVSSTTAMVNLSETQAAVRRAREIAPNLGIGIHLNLTAGPPVLAPTEIPSLITPDGQFYPIRRLIPRLDELDLCQVEKELTAQIERFRSWGGEPTHLDCHHHLLYLSPHLFQVLVEIAQQYQLPIRYPWAGKEAQEEKDKLADLAQAHRIPPEELPTIITQCNNILRQSGLRAPDRCILSFYGTGASRENLLAQIAHLPPGTSELMCHPGLADDSLRAQSGYTQQREQELAILTSNQIKKAFETHSVQLVTFQRLSRHPLFLHR